MFLWVNVCDFLHFFKSYLGVVLFVQLLSRTPQSCGSCFCAAKGRLLYIRGFLQQSVPFLEPRFLVTNPGQTNSSSCPVQPHPARSKPTGTGTGPRAGWGGRCLWHLQGRVLHSLEPRAPSQIFVSFLGMGEKRKCQPVYVFTQTVYSYKHCFPSQLLSPAPKNYLIFESVYTHCVSAH